MNVLLKRLQVALLSAGMLSLAACGGGGGGGGGTASTSVTVSPSLGKFTAGALVTIKKLDGTTLGSGKTVAGGTATVDIGAYSGPMLVEVSGAAGVKYFDEGTNKEEDFGSGETLSAIAPAVSTSIGVTTATHAAVEAIKAANSNAVPPAISTDNIRLANAKVAAALGITDVLQAPQLVDKDSAASTSKLDLADAKHKYALQLAAIAKLAGTNKNALAVAKDLAKDLSDNKLDGQFDPTLIGKTGSVVANTATQTFSATTVKTLIEDKLKEAATTFANDDTKNVISNDPTVIGTVKPDVSTVTAPPADTDTSYLQKAKAFFGELRSTLNAYLNGAKVGYLDKKAQQASDDIREPLATSVDAVVTRMDGLQSGIDTFVVAKNPSAYPNFTLTQEPEPGNSSNTVYTYRKGSLPSVYYGQSFTKCWTDTNVSASISKVVCIRAGGQSYDAANDRVKLVRYEISPVAGATNTFDYQAKRINAKVDTKDGNGAPTSLKAPTDALDNLRTTATTDVPLAAGSGRLSYTKDGNGDLATLSIDGSFPASERMCIAPNADSKTQQSASCPSGKIEVPATTGDAVKLSASRTSLGANAYRYALEGEISSKKFPEGTATAFAAVFNKGSIVDIEESNTSDPSIKNMELAASLQSRNTKFAGSVVLNAMVKDKSGQRGYPTKAVLNGSFSDVTPSTGAGEVLTGKLESSVSNWSSYDATAATSASNYPTGSVTFTGSVKHPNRPEMKLVLSATATGFEQGTASVTFSYNTITVTGSRTGGLTEKFKVSNQDGIVLAQKTGDEQTLEITKNDKLLGSVKDGVIKYVDGVSESLK
ncbi:MAG: hypothetical protein ACT4NV_19980 [Rhodoferax sp.]